MSRKITRALCNISQGLEQCLYMGNMDAKRDWGHARDYVEMQWLMLQQEVAEDFVIATGQQTSVRDFIIRAASELGITITFEGQGLKEVGKVAAIESSKADPNITLAVGDVLVGVDEKYYRPTEVETLLGDPTKARDHLGWKPKITLKEMIHEMMENDLCIDKRDELIEMHGYKTMNYHE